MQRGAGRRGGLEVRSLSSVHTSSSYSTRTPGDVPASATLAQVTQQDRLTTLRSSSNGIISAPLADLPIGCTLPTWSVVLARARPPPLDVREDESSAGPFGLGVFRWVILIELCTAEAPASRVVTLASYVVVVRGWMSRWWARSFRLFSALTSLKSSYKSNKYL